MPKSPVMNMVVGMKEVVVCLSLYGWSFVCAWLEIRIMNE